jgi:hypothetical protein
MLGGPPGARAVAVARASYLAHFCSRLDAAARDLALDGYEPDECTWSVPKCAGVKSTAWSSLSRELVAEHPPWPASVSWFSPCAGWASEGVVPEALMVSNGVAPAMARDLLRLAEERNVTVYVRRLGQYWVISASHDYVSFDGERARSPEDRERLIDRALARPPPDLQAIVDVTATDRVEMFRDPGGMLPYAAWLWNAKAELIRTTWAPARHVQWCLSVDERP